MASGSIFKLITSDGVADREFMRGRLLDDRLREINYRFSKIPGRAQDKIDKRLKEIERIREKKSK